MIAPSHAPSASICRNRKVEVIYYSQSRTLRGSQGRIRTQFVRVFQPKAIYEGIGSLSVCSNGCFRLVSMLLLCIVHMADFPGFSLKLFFQSFGIFTVAILVPISEVAEDVNEREKQTQKQCAPSFPLADFDERPAWQAF